MTIKFTKMQGLGNDFVVLNALEQSFNLTALQIQRMANRHYGIGFDQLLMIEPSDNNHADFNYRIFNADGSEVGQCGNGARCVARYLYAHAYIKKSHIILATRTSRLNIQLESNDLVTVDMGPPNFEPLQIPCRAEQRMDKYELNLEGQTIQFGAVSMGNPHAVILIDDIQNVPIATLGPKLQQHQFFPEQVNVGFMKVIDRQHIRLRVYERGAGETLACGSGACAAVAIGRTWQLLDHTVNVTLAGGSLRVHWPGEPQSLLMTGPAEFVYTGEWLAF